MEPKTKLYLYLNCKDVCDKFLALMSELGINFMIGHPGQRGSTFLDVEEMKEYLTDKEMFIDRYNAHCSNLSLENYLKAKNIFEGGNWRCCAVSTKRKRCKHVIKELDETGYRMMFPTDIIEIIGLSMENTGLICRFHSKRLAEGSNVNILPIRYWEDTNC